jgi:hypothetical protein
MISLFTNGEGRKGGKRRSDTPSVVLPQTAAAVLDINMPQRTPPNFRQESGSYGAMPGPGKKNRCLLV